MTDLFKPSNATGGEEIKSYKDHLVGEGKKFKDEESLARAKYESDLFIQKVQAENEEMRKELSTRMTLEEFWEKTKTAQSKTNEDRDDNRREETSAQTNAPKPEDIAEMVRRELSTEKTKSQKAENVEYVRQELTKTWGPNFQERLVRKAAELGSSVDFLGTMAETQPKAFLALMVGNPQGKPATNEYVPPRSSITSSHQIGDTRNFAHYEKLRKENPTQYWTPKVQTEMYKMARELGEDFYKS